MYHRQSRNVAGIVLLLLLLCSHSHADDPTALEYLEGLKGKPDRYIAPSEIDPRYTIALYVNATTSGANKQRMWILQRDRIGGEWALALWDKKYWNKKGIEEGKTPPFSWHVSTGRKYRGDKFSGPTPHGVYSLDERKGRSRRGWHAAGMKHTLFIDYHYSSGRPSGVAFHGTTRSRYRRLGRADSHGCIRMKQHNALDLLNRVRGWDKVLPEEMRWGEVPRFWKGERGRKRWGYVRDGSMHPFDFDEPKRVAEAAIEDYTAIVDESPFPKVLTKIGYRAIAVIFRD